VNGDEMQNPYTADSQVGDPNPVATRDPDTSGVARDPRSTRCSWDFVHAALAQARDTDPEPARDSDAAGAAGYTRSAGHPGDLVHDAGSEARDPDTVSSGDSDTSGASGRARVSVVPVGFGRMNVCELKFAVIG
jgi:hypothetical protein